MKVEEYYDYYNEVPLEGEDVYKIITDGNMVIYEREKGLYLVLILKYIGI